VHLLLECDEDAGLLSCSDGSMEGEVGVVFGTGFYAGVYTVYLRML